MSLAVKRMVEREVVHKVLVGVSAYRLSLFLFSLLPCSLFLSCLYSLVLIMVF